MPTERPAAGVSASPAPLVLNGFTASLHAAKNAHRFGMDPLPLADHALTSYPATSCIWLGQAEDARRHAEHALQVYGPPRPRPVRPAARPSPASTTDDPGAHGRVERVGSPRHPKGIAGGEVQAGGGNVLLLTVRGDPCSDPRGMERPAETPGEQLARHAQAGAGGLVSQEQRAAAGDLGGRDSLHEGAVRRGAQHVEMRA
ncbi:hypothetical protein [Kitasatospora sp. NPDC056531]|uniref:hypothetical protein n=1 Tax=Kitasatospora sp. NPDC056531 TaxID=3345856 RepID=UPI0036961032